MSSFNCCVNGCTQSSIYPGPEEKYFKFHLFPTKNPELLNKWIIALKKEKSFKPKNDSLVCSRHFTENDYKSFSWSQKKMLKEDAVPSKFLNGPEGDDLNEDDAVLPESDLTEDQSGVFSLPIQQEIANEQDLNITKIASDKTSPKLNLVAKRITNESGTLEGNAMEQIPKGNKRGADNDGTVSIDNFLQAKRLRKTLMDKMDSQIKTEPEETADGNIGEYNYEDDDDEEMVIVVVQKDGESSMNNYGEEEEEECGYVGEEVTYDSFMDGNESVVEESVVSTEVHEEPMMPADSQTEKFVEKEIIGNKTLSVKKELCRLCLSEHCNMLPLFETSLRFIKSSLEVIIESCTGVQVLKEDATDRICRACISRLESFWAFREQCEKSDKLVKQMKEMNQTKKAGKQEFEDGNPDTDDHACNNAPLKCLVGSDPFHCSNCGKTYRTELALSAHVTRDHAHLQPFIQKASYIVRCSICGRRVLKRVLHDHYLGHKLLGHGNNKGEKTVMGEEEEEEDDDEEEEEEDEEETEENDDGEEEGEEVEEQPSYTDLEDGETIDGEEHITEFLNKENELGFNQDECFVTEISGSEFINVNRGDDEVAQQNVNRTGEKSPGKVANNPKVIAVRINDNEDVKAGHFQETPTPQYTQVFLVNQAVNDVVETAGSLSNDGDDNNVVATTSLDENHIYVVESDGKYTDQDVVFQIANDNAYRSDGGVVIKDEIEVVYENTIESVFVKEEVIDTNSDDT